MEYLPYFYCTYCNMCLFYSINRILIMGNHQSTSILESKKVVVVGGGFAGAHAIRHLQGKCQLTVIDPREYLHYSIGSLRASVQPGNRRQY